MSGKREFRVWWRREGAHRATAIFQTEAAARRKADGIVALEAVKRGSRFDEMPDLVEVPVIEVRDVSEWREHDRVTEPSVRALERMEAWAVPDDDAGYSGIF